MLNISSLNSGNLEMSQKNLSVCILVSDLHPLFQWLKTSITEIPVFLSFSFYPIWLSHKWVRSGAIIHLFPYLSLEEAIKIQCFLYTLCIFALKRKWVLPPAGFLSPSIHFMMSKNRPPWISYLISSVLKWPSRLYWNNSYVWNILFHSSWANIFTILWMTVLLSWKYYAYTYV